jgi:biotin synthase
MNLDFSALRDKALAGQAPTFDEAMEILSLPDRRLPELYEAVRVVRERFRGKSVSIQTLTSARNGNCTEDCFYCAQAKDSSAGTPIYGSVDQAAWEAKGLEAKAAGAARHCVALSGLRFSDAEVEDFALRLEKFKAAVKTPVCCSVGLLTKNQAERLKRAGADRINHNLNTGPGFYGRICTSHTWEERRENLLTIKEAGLGICCGGIVGMGESDRDVAEMLTEIAAVRGDIEDLRAMKEPPEEEDDQ